MVRTAGLSVATSRPDRHFGCARQRVRGCADVRICERRKARTFVRTLPPARLADYIAYIAYTAYTAPYSSLRCAV